MKNGLRGRWINSVAHMNPMAGTRYIPAGRFG